MAYKENNQKNISYLKNVKYENDRKYGVKNDVIMNKFEMTSAPQ